MPRVRLLSYWRAEQRTIRQGLVAMLLASVAMLGAGVALGFITDTLESLPGLMVMVPAAIAARGNVFGALASRLGTAIHAGLFTTTREREGVLYQNVFAAAALTLSISLLMAVLAKTLSATFGVTSISILDFALISILGGVLASVVVLGLTIVLAVTAQRRGWDLDSVAAPLITAAGDILTVPAIFLATFAVGYRWVSPTLTAILTVVTLVAAIRAAITDLPATRRIARESLPVLTIAATIDILAGLMIESRIEQFVAFPVLLILIPPILGDAGGLGGILSSRLASKLHLGVITPRGLPEAAALSDLSIVALFAVVVFPLVGVAAHVVAGLVGIATPGMGTVVGVSLLAGLLATAAASVVAYYAAIASFRMGMDPDSHGIPLITSSMDLAGVVALILAILAFGIG
ncbi:MAG TPA: magnesium transporter [Actinomycetota bacterium]